MDFNGDAKMNEQIEQIYAKVCDRDMEYLFNKDMANRFAELIIRECSTILRETDFAFELKPEFNTANNGAELGATVIERHFGV